MMLSYAEYCESGMWESFIVQSEDLFNAYIFEAEAKIKAATYGRINEGNASKAVKMCIAKLVNLYAKANMVNDNVSSYSNDGVSQSFVILSRDDYEKAIDATIRTYLANEVDSEGTPRLYLGVR